METPYTISTSKDAPAAPPVKSHKKPIMLVLVALMVICLMVAVWSVSQLLSTKSNTEELERSNQLLISRNEELIKQNEKLNSDIEAYKKKEEEQKMDESAHTDPIIIKSLSLNKSWKEAELQYQLSTAYLAADISDIDDFRTNAEVVNKDFVLMTVKVTDNRSTGVQRLISQGSYLKMQVKEQTLNPVINSVKYILPQETVEVHSVFAVEKGSEKMTLLAGLAGKTESLALDFQKGTTLKGTLSYKEGFKEVESSE